QREAGEAVDGAAERPALRRLVELTQLGAVELVSLAELVQEPDDLVRVADDVGGELRRDDEVDRRAVGLLQVEQPPEKRLREDAFARIPLERDRDELHVVPAPAQ